MLKNRIFTEDKYTVMLKILRWPIRVIATLILLFVIYVNIRLLETPVCDPAPGGYVAVDAVKQLHYLKRVLHEDKAAEEMHYAGKDYQVPAALRTK